MSYARASCSCDTSDSLCRFKGIGLGSGSKVELAYHVAEGWNAEWWQRCKVLIIDEVSMIDGELFDKLDYIARIVRGKNKPFGGIQLVCSGDFFQVGFFAASLHVSNIVMIYLITTIIFVAPPHLEKGAR